MSPRISYHAEDEASRAIAAADPVLADLIAKSGCVEFEPTLGGEMEVLVRAIAGQQLSGAAANAIFERVAQRVGVSADALAEASANELHAAGLSRRKARTIQQIARAIVSGELDLNALEALDDDAVVDELTQLDGVGPWTAQVYLLFAMGRPDVLLANDVGVRTSAGEVYGLGRPMTSDEFLLVSERWRPYRSAATLYLWSRGRSGFGGCEEEMG